MSSVDGAAVASNVASDMRSQEEPWQLYGLKVDDAACMSIESLRECLHAKSGLKPTSAALRVLRLKAIRAYSAGCEQKQIPVATIEPFFAMPIAITTHRIKIRSSAAVALYEFQDSFDGGDPLSCIRFLCDDTEKVTLEDVQEKVATWLKRMACSQSAAAFSMAAESLADQVMVNIEQCNEVVCRLRLNADRSVSFELRLYHYESTD